MPENDDMTPKMDAILVWKFPFNVRYMKTSERTIREIMDPKEMIFIPRKVINTGSEMGTESVAQKKYFLWKKCARKLESIIDQKSMCMGMKNVNLLIISIEVRIKYIVGRINDRHTAERNFPFIFSKSGPMYMGIDDINMAETIVPH